MKKIGKFRKSVLETFKETKDKSLLVYLILRLLVILCMVRQFFLGEYFNVFLCFVYLLLLFIPMFIQSKLKISIPTLFEIFIYLFIFSGTILGEINNFYGKIPHFDTILHTLNGFLATSVGLSLFYILNKNSKNINLSPIYLCLLSFCFSMTVGVVWEVFEFSMDKFFLMDAQKDYIVDTISSVSFGNDNQVEIIRDIDKTVLYNKDGEVLKEISGGYLDIGINDTMKDLIVNLIGALVFCVISYFYLVNNKNDKILNNLIVTKGTDKVIDLINMKLKKS